MSLEKAQIMDNDGLGVNLTVCFNPKELKVSKTAAWTMLDGSVNDEPTQVFGKPAPATMSVTLQFDTYETKQSVYKTFIQQLEKCTLIMGEGAQGRPPLVTFVWNNFVFKGVITSLDQNYTMFLEDGTPVRCDCTVSLTKARAAKTADPKSAAGGSGGSGGGGAPPPSEPFAPSTPLWNT